MNTAQQLPVAKVTDVTLNYMRRYVVFLCKKLLVEESGKCELSIRSRTLVKWQCWALEALLTPFKMAIAISPELRYSKTCLRIREAFKPRIPFKKLSTRRLASPPLFNCYRQALREHALVAIETYNFTNKREDACTTPTIFTRFERWAAHINYFRADVGRDR